MKICLQAGHGNRTSGSTGAPEEQKWTMEIVPKIASKLREHGFEVKEVMADPSDAEIAGDWALFLAVHYDADMYNDRGGFIDIPEASTDSAHEESARIAEEMKQVYFPITGIPAHPERSNKNTKFYYMWKRLSAKTPCVIIEAGVGFRVEEDWKTLWHNQDKVIEGIVTGILNALKPTVPEPPVEPTPDSCEQVKLDLSVIYRSLDVDNIDEAIAEIMRLHVKEVDCNAHECPITPEPEPIKSFDVICESFYDSNGKFLSEKRTVKPIK